MPSTIPSFWPQARDGACALKGPPLVVVCLPWQPGLNLLEVGPLRLPPKLLPKFVLGHLNFWVRKENCPLISLNLSASLWYPLTMACRNWLPTPNSPQTFTLRSKTASSTTACRESRGGDPEVGKVLNVPTGGCCPPGYPDHTGPTKSRSCSKPALRFGATLCKI